MLDLIRREPALVAALVNTLIGAAVLFGLDLTVEQSAAIVAVANAVLALVVRSQVTPTAKAPKAPQPRP